MNRILLSIFFLLGIEVCTITASSLHINSIDSNGIVSYVVEKDVPVKLFFKTLESLAKRYTDSLHYHLNLYQLVNHNSWIIDSLSHTSYYWLKEKGIKEINQKDRIVIKKGTVLIIPSQKEAEILSSRLSANKILVNIPECKLRIFHEDLLIFDCPIRVGKNESKYLKSIDKYMDLRTRKGKGFVYNTQHNPVWINPVDGKRYFETKRDDGVVTKMPITPSITNWIDGYVSGQLIHATTNNETLGKAYSNGCIGTSEDDIWRIFFYCPPGTEVEILYDLTLGSNTGDLLPNIYDKQQHKYK